MGRIEFTAADRGPDGRLLVESPMDRVRRLQAELDTPAEQAAPEQPVEITPQLGRHSVVQLVGAILAILVMSGLAIWSFWPAAQPPAPPIATAAPTGAAAALNAPPVATEGPQIDAYAAPDGALLGPIDASAKIVFRHSDYPGWGAVRWQGAIVWVRTDQALDELPDLAEPTPAPTPIIIKVEVPVEPPCDLANSPRYTAKIDVTADDGRRKLGYVTGASCDSQAAAQADAELRAAQMRAAAPTPCPTWAGPPFVKPDCA